MHIYTHNFSQNTSNTPKTLHTLYTQCIKYSQSIYTNLTHNISNTFKTPAKKTLRSKKYLVKTRKYGNALTKTLWIFCILYS